MVNWTTDEFETVAKAWIETCKKQHDDPLKPKVLSKVIMKAQESLPVTRRRPKTSLQGIKNLRPIMDVVKLQLTKPTEVSKLANEIEPHQEATDDSLVLRDVGVTSLVGELEVMIHSFAKNIAAMVVEETITQMKNEFKKEFPKLHQQASVFTKAIPKIMVVGPLVKQQEILEESVNGIVDLKFVSSEEGAKLITMRGASCAACVVWASKVSHSHQNAVQKMFARESTRYISGGLESVKGALEEIALQVSV